MSKKFFPLLLYILCQWTCQGQVINDSLKNAIPIALESFLFSSTAGCTVEWTCVDEKLTGKCIKYHNDQWFYIRPSQDGDYFINISGQNCRDQKGVQLVVGTGEPCDSSYSILSCTSLATQDDVFVPLESLSANVKYWLNVDGYLEDNCRFYIEWSRSPKGLPTSAKSTVTMDIKNRSRAGVFCLDWKISPEQANSWSHFELYRRERSEKRHLLKKTIPLLSNAKGDHQRHYTTCDSTDQRQYHYRLLAYPRQGPPLVLKSFLKKKESDPMELHGNSLPLHLNYKNGTSITVSVRDARRKTLLKNIDFLYKKKLHETILLDIKTLRVRGIERLEIDIRDNDNEVRQHYLYRLK